MIPPWSQPCYRYITCCTFHYIVYISCLHILNVMNHPLSSLWPILYSFSFNPSHFYLRLLCFGDMADIILVQEDIFERAGISSVLPLRPIFWQKCHQRLFRQSCRHGFQQRLFQHTWEGLGHAMQCSPVLLHYVLSCVLHCELLLDYVLVSCAECLRIGAPPSYNIRATSLCQPSLATAGVRHQIYGKDSFPIPSIPHLKLCKYPALKCFSLVTTLN